MGETKTEEKPQVEERPLLEKTADGKGWQTPCPHQYRAIENLYTEIDSKTRIYPFYCIHCLHITHRDVTLDE